MLRNKLIKNLALAVAVCSLANVLSFGTGALAAEATDNGTTTYDFNDGILPDCFDSTMFTVEDGMLKANDNTSGFEIDNMSKNYSAEFKIKPLKDDVEQAFNLYFGNVTVFFDGANGKNSSWSDAITLSKRKDGTQINKLWANKSYFPDRTNGHTVKAVVNSNIHSLYIDNSLIISGECTDTADSNSLLFSLSKNVSTAGVYLDDIVITKQADTTEITTSGSLYAYNFNDGVLPARFDSTKFSIENNMLKASGTGSFTFSNVPKNSTIEFDIKPLADTYVPGFNVEIGNLRLRYSPNCADPNKGWNDQINMYNRVDWNTAQAQQVWADGKSGRPSGNFFPSATGHKMKVVSYGDTHSIYIDGIKIGSGEFTGKLSTDYNVDVGVDSGVYLDNIIVKDSSEPYNFDFNDGILPEMFDSDNFAVSDNMLYVRGSGAGFTLDEMTGNCSIEFKIKPFTGELIPEFGVEVGKASVAYKSQNSQNSSWNDVINMYNRISWDSTQMKQVWADGQSGRPKGNFFPSADGYTLKYVAKDDIHRLYIDGVLMLEGELTGELTDFNIKFVVGSAATTGLYLDDIKVNLLDYEPEFKAAVSVNANTKTCNVTIRNIEDENVLIFATYKGEQLVDLQIKDCTNDSEVFTSTDDIDEIQVMIWSNLEKLVPVYSAIAIPQSEWTVVSEQ